jgi:hypothetical protein
VRRPLYLAPLLVALGAVCCFATGGLKSKAVYDFSKGCDTYHSSLSLPDGFVQNSQDVFFDAQAPVSKRKGYTTVFSTNTGAYQAEWVYTDPSNTTWIIVRSSGQITANNLAGTTVKIATTSANDLVGETNSQGNAYFVDQTQGVYYWNGTATTFVAGSPKGSLITSFHLRIWVSGAAVPNGNQLYGSAYGDGTKWTIGLNPNDPVQLTVGLQDNFDNITAIYPFLDTLYTTKHYSIYALYGFDQTSFQISFITSECGCIDQQSIQTFNHGLDFVSMRGVEFFDGYTCTKISEPMKNKVDPAILSQGGSNAQSWVQSLPSDWNSGTLTPSGNLSTVVATPGLTLSTFSATENSSTQWNLGTATNLNINASSITLPINNSGTVNEPSFEVGPAPNPINDSSWASTETWRYSSGIHDSSNACGTLSPHQGSLMAYDSCNGQVGINPRAYILDINENPLVVVNLSKTDTACSWVQTTLPSSGLVGRRVKFKFTEDYNTGGTTSLETVNSYILGGDVTFYQAGYNISGIPQCFAIDDIQNGSSTITSGSFTSQVFNTGMSSPTYSIASTGYTVNTSTPLFSLQTSGSPSGPWTTIETTTGTNVQGFQYAQYIASMSINSSDNALSSINNISVSATASTGVFTSQVHSLGTTTAFGNFAVQDFLPNGNISFSICTAAAANMSGETCAVQTPNSQITVAPNNFVQVSSTFTTNISTGGPVLNSFTVQWYSGNRTPGMASTVWHGRYWLSLSTNPVDNFNDAILVLDTAGAWAPFNIPAGGLTQSKGNLYIADSHSTGNDYLYGQGYRDNGAPINAFIVTKDYPESDLNTDDYYESLYVSEDNLGNFNTTISYAMDRNLSSPFTLSSINQQEYTNNAAIKVPFVFGNQDFGKCISLTFTEADLDSPWNFYGFTLYYHDRVVQ